MTPRLLTRPQAAAYLGISEVLFDTRVATTVPAVPLGDSTLGIRYDRRDLDTWADQQPREVPGRGCRDTRAGSSARPGKPTGAVALALSRAGLTPPLLSESRSR
jgi:hypothetical protein